VTGIQECGLVTYRTSVDVKFGASDQQFQNLFIAVLSISRVAVPTERMKNRTTAVIDGTVNVKIRILKIPGYLLNVSSFTCMMECFFDRHI